VSTEFPGTIDTSTPYVIGKVVSRLEMDSRWALARSVRALVAERDALKEKLETGLNECDARRSFDASFRRLTAAQPPR
jgi:hypothetical protein